MSERRVLMLSQEVHPIPPTKGAAVEQWIEAVAHRLEGFQVHVVSPLHPYRPRTEFDGRVHYHRISLSRLYRRLFRKLTRLDPYPYIQRVNRYAASIGVDIVHLHNAPHFVAPIVKRLPRAPLLLHMHNLKQLSHTDAVACLIGCSDFITDAYRGAAEAARTYRTIPNGVDANEFTSCGEKPAERASVRNAYGVPSKIVVLYVGRISPEKGPDRLVDAFRRLDPERFHLVLVGEWPQGDPKRNERVAYANKLRQDIVECNTTILDTVVPDAMRQIYCLGDLLVIPSRFDEPFSMVAIEAMASGLPVVAVRKGGMLEYMSHGENAHLISGDATPHEMAKAIERVATDPSYAKYLGAAGRRLVRGHFTWERVAEKTAALYGELLHGT